MKRLLKVPTDIQAFGGAHTTGLMRVKGETKWRYTQVRRLFRQLRNAPKVDRVGVETIHSDHMFSPNNVSSRYWKAVDGRLRGKNIEPVGLENSPSAELLSNLNHYLERAKKKKFPAKYLAKISKRKRMALGLLINSVLEKFPRMSRRQAESLSHAVCVHRSLRMHEEARAQNLKLVVMGSYHAADFEHLLGAKAAYTDRNKIRFDKELRKRHFQSYYRLAGFVEELEKLSKGIGVTPADLKRLLEARRTEPPLP